MHALWITAWLLAAEPMGATAASAKPLPTTVQPAKVAGAENEPLYKSDAETDAKLRSVYELKSQIRAALKREATSAADSEAHLAATLELVALFAALQASEHLSPDEALRLKTQVRSRLIKIAAGLRNDLKRTAAAQAKAAKLPAIASPGEAKVIPLFASQDATEAATAGSSDAKPKSGLALSKETLLFQIGAAIGQQPNGAAEAGEALIEVIKGATGPHKWDDHGGPGSIFLWRGSSLMQPLRQAGANALAGAMGGRAVDDHGPELVELIESVISPNTWEKNGGFGSIMYFAPLHVIVVRSTGDVHGNVGNVIGNLRAAGN